MATLVKLYELQEGEKFYDIHTDIIYEMISCEYDETNLNTISYVAKQYKTNSIGKYTISGLNVANQEYYKYNGRDKSSFLAGFRSAMRICTAHMGKFDKENAELDDEFKVYMTMLKAYKKWNENKE
jgi:hypothetical protein